MRDDALSWALLAEWVGFRRMGSVAGGPQNPRKQLLAMRAAIESLEESRRDGSGIVELDQARTGRLSRMDALQMQAMAKAGQSRSQLRLKQIEAALKRLDDGRFGGCFDCGDKIAATRLEGNPTVTLCVTCATRREGSRRD